MFATLLGGLPNPTLEPGVTPAEDDLIVAAIQAQEAAGLEPITDGRLRDPGFERCIAALHRGDPTGAVVVAGWQFAAGHTDRAVKQALPGPYSLGRSGASSADQGRERRTMALAEGLRREIEALAVAGCPMIEIEETEAHRIGEDEGERRLFREAHRLLAEGMTGAHLSLSIVGGSAAAAGIETIMSAPYASLAVDLIEGPDNWNLVTRLAGDRGVVAGALSGREGGDESKELLLWAAHYAASTGGRGIARVGLGSAGSFANLAWASAVRKMQRVGEAARLAALPPSEELMRSLDPTLISARRAALGHDAPPRPRRGTVR
jgi:methionine synthase II (cobalamin-independent)